MNIFKNYKLLEILLLGVVSGMPYSIIVTAITACLHDNQIPIAVITTFGIAKLSYSLKFLWSPLIDYIKIPILTKSLGQRKSWLFLCSLVNCLLLILISQTSPVLSLNTIYVVTIIFGICAATFDIAFDALRIENFDERMQSFAAANAVLGYRLGMHISSAGALVIAHTTSSWPNTFIVLGTMFFIAALFILTVKENKISRTSVALSIESISNMWLEPAKDFFIRKSSILMLLTVVFFKLSDSMLASVSLVFCMEIGFSKDEIALVFKTFGLISAILGSYLGAFIIYKIGTFPGLIITNILQSVTNLTFVWLHHSPYMPTLVIGTFLDNITGGMGTAGLVGYLGSLCNRKYSATQYALLSSASSVFSNLLPAYSGKLVHILGWDGFFILTTILGIPGIIMLYMCSKIFKHVYS